MRRLGRPEDRLEMGPELAHFCYERRSLFYAKADLPEVERWAGHRHACTDTTRLAEITAIGRRFRSQPPTSVTPLDSQGTFHRLYRLEYASHRSLIVRVNALDTDLTPLIDAWAMRRLAQHGLPAPSIHAVEFSRAIFPFDYVVIDEAPGQALSDFDEQEEAIQRLLRSLGNLLARLHGIRADGFGLLDVSSLRAPAAPPRGLHGSWQEYLLLKLNSHLQVCSRIGAVCQAEAVQIEQLFGEAAEWIRGIEPVLLHGDLGNHNVFTDGTRITAILDWEDALAGDPVYDIAFWATFHPQRRHAAFLEGYQEIRELPVDFAARFWLYYLRIALAKTVVRHRLNLPDLPGRPPASRRIGKALDMLRMHGSNACWAA